MGGWTQAIASNVGQLGSDAGVAVDHNIELGLQVIRQRLMAQEVQSRLRESELRTKALSSPKFQTLPTPGGGTAGVMTDPFTNAPQGPPQTVIPGQLIPKTTDQAWLEATTAEQGHPPSAEQIEKHQGLYKNPVNTLLQQAAEANLSGDTQTAQTLTQLATQLREVQKGPAAPSLISLIMGANAGDPKSQEGLRSYMALQTQLAKAKGEGYGMGRAAYVIQPYIDGATGQMIPMSSLDALEAIHAGRTLTPSGRLSPKDTIAIQQLQSEAPPALKQVRQYVKAFDNTSDRLILARVMASNPAATPGLEASWVRNILDQAATQGLSDDGKHLLQASIRLNESVGRVRSVLGLPSTERMVAMSLAMVPGPATPDSKFAGEMLDNLEQVINNASAVPILKGVTGNSGPGGPPPGATVLNYDPATGTVK